VCSSSSHMQQTSQRRDDRVFRRHWARHLSEPRFINFTLHLSPRHLHISPTVTLAYCTTKPCILSAQICLNEWLRLATPLADIEYADAWTHTCTCKARSKNTTAAWFTSWIAVLEPQIYSVPWSKSTAPYTKRTVQTNTTKKKECVIIQAKSTSKPPKLHYPQAKVVIVWLIARPSHQRLAFAAAISS
jgi:hypothetical protein